MSWVMRVGEQLGEVASQDAQLATVGRVNEGYIELPSVKNRYAN